MEHRSAGVLEYGNIGLMNRSLKRNFVHPLCSLCLCGEISVLGNGGGHG
jgi:hypothetical protein